MSQDPEQPSAKSADPSETHCKGAVPATGEPALLEIPLDVLVAILGGASAKEALSGFAGVSTFIATLDAPRAWLSPGTTAAEPSTGVVQQFALEVASLKLRCFDALVRLLIVEDHLRGLPIARVNARMADQPGALRPARWAFELHLGKPTGGTNSDSLGADLGNVLACLLLANDARTPAQAQELAGTLAGEFGAAANKMQNATPEQLAITADAMLSRGEIANSNNLLHCSAMRNRVQGAAIAPKLWLAATRLLLRLQTQVAGFSFGSAPLLDLYGELTKLAQHLDVATFGAMARRDAIAAVVRNELEKLQ